MHVASECPRPHSSCTDELCVVTPIHAHYEPRVGHCAHYAAHTSGRRMTPYEEEAAYGDPLYIEDYLDMDE